MRVAIDVDAGSGQRKKQASAARPLEQSLNCYCLRAAAAAANSLALVGGRAKSICQRQCQSKDHEAKTASPKFGRPSRGINSLGSVVVVGVVVIVGSIDGVGVGAARIGDGNLMLHKPCPCLARVLSRRLSRKSSRWKRAREAISGALKWSSNSRHHHNHDHHSR